MVLNIKNKFETACILYMLFFSITIFAQEPADFVNPFIGTSNYGAAFPGPIAPRGMASISPFNVAGVKNTPMEKDSQWLSNPYVNENTFLTGFSQVNLSGVGCPDLGVILLMPTTGNVEIDHLKYGSTYSNEVAKAAYYSVNIDKYKVKGEFTTSKRVGVSRFTFPKGQSNILLNLGLGLTNEEGAMIKVVSSTEIEGMRSVGSFCYNSPEDAYPVYFVAQFSKPAHKFGVWKKPAKYDGVEAQWMGYNGKARIMENTIKTVVDDSIGSYFTYKFDKQETVEVKIGISYVSIENARENLAKEVGNRSFDAIYKETYNEWNEELSKILVEGGTKDDNTIFYTALYHTLIHPNILNDINGQYPVIKRSKIAKTDDTRYTVFSLWDTYRNVHPLMSLVYPKQQSDMVKSMLTMFDENGWLPKWELNSTETFTMVGDPASIVITDTYMRGVRDYDVNKAYYAMLKGADNIENNPLRPGLKDYIKKGYLTTDNKGPVSTTQEYNISDYSISLMANEFGDKDNVKRFKERSLSYRKLFDKNLNLIRPRTADGKWYEPFDPASGANFEENVGFIEGNAWQYAFMVPHDIIGLKKLMGGDQAFSAQLQKIFDIKQFDMANEPDIANPYLFNYVKGEEYKTQEMVKKLVREYFKNEPKGLPGNDDTGTMSAWLVYSMMGIYPISPGDPIYTITTPMFHRVTIKLDPRYYKKENIVIERQENNGGKINSIEINGKTRNSFFISHDDFVNGTKLKVIQN